VADTVRQLHRLTQGRARLESTGEASRADHCATECELSASYFATLALRGIVESPGPGRPQSSRRAADEAGRA